MMIGGEEFSDGPASFEPLSGPKKPGFFSKGRGMDRKPCELLDAN